MNVEDPPINIKVDNKVLVLEGNMDDMVIEGTVVDIDRNFLIQKKDTVVPRTIEAGENVEIDIKKIVDRTVLVSVLHQLVKVRNVLNNIDDIINIQIKDVRNPLKHR